MDEADLEETRPALPPDLFAIDDEDPDGFAEAVGSFSPDFVGAALASSDPVQSEYVRESVLSGL